MGAEGREEQDQYHISYLSCQKKINLLRSSALTNVHLLSGCGSLKRSEERRREAES